MQHHENVRGYKKRKNRAESWTWDQILTYSVDKADFDFLSWML